MVKNHHLQPIMYSVGTGSQYSTYNRILLICLFKYVGTFNGTNMI